MYKDSVISEHQISLAAVKEKWEKNPLDVFKVRANTRWGW